MSGRHRAARRQLTLGEHAFWTIVVAVAVVTAGLAVWFLAQQSGEQPAAATSRSREVVPQQRTPCVWHEQLSRTLAQRGEDPADWRVTDLDGDWGRTNLDKRTARLDPSIPCRLVSSVVLHEWMHLQQARKFGGARASYGAYGGDAERLELTADCGAMFLGAGYWPYVAEHRKATGVGCSAAYMAAAQALIYYRPDVEVSSGLGMVGNTRAWNHG